MTEKSQECWQCRLTSGGGLLGMGVYVIRQSKKVKTSRFFVTSIGYALTTVGILKLFALPPFKSHPVLEESNPVEENEGNEYIIGKIPPKFQ